MKLIYIPEAWRMLKQRLKIGFRGIDKYKGDSKEICEQIIKDCWNTRYFQVSTGHFCQFYTRDFGWCIEPLMKLGYEKEVKKTLNYAVTIFNKNNKITTTITPSSIAYDFPCYAPDSLAFFIRSLRISNSFDVIKKNKDFLNNEIKKYFDIVIDKDTGLAKKDKRFSSMKDRYFRESSCYDNIMSAMLKDDLSKIKILNNPFKNYNYNYKKTIKDTFWTGDYFLDDLKSKHIAGDANVIPYWTKVFNNKNMIKKSVDSIINNKLDKPFPLKYTSKKPKQKAHWTEILSPNYEGNTIWTQLGMMYIKVVKNINKEMAQNYIFAYKKVIERYKNFIELFNPDGTLYKNIFYHADTGMLWASMFLELVK